MMKKTVWLINEGENLPGDDNNPRLQRMGLLAYEVSKLDGVEVVWWQSTFNHYQKKFRWHGDKTVQLKDNLKLVMLHSYGYSKNVCLRRLAHEWKTAYRFYKLAEHEPLPDVMVAAMPTIAQAHYVVKFGRKHGIPVLVDLRDLNPDVFVSPFRGFMRQCVKIGIKPLQWMLGNALKHADGLIGTTEPYLNWGLNYAKRPKGDNDRVFFVSYSDSGVPTKLNNEDKWGKYLGYEGIVCCYFGQFGRLMDFDTVIDAAELCQKNGVKALFLLCGDGELLEHCRGKVKKRGLSNVELPGWVNKTDIADIGFVADAGLMGYQNDENFNMQMPNKFSEYLSLRLAILLQPTGVMEKVITDHQCGVRYDNANELYEAVKALAEDREKLELYKKNSRAVFEKYFSVEKIYKEYSEYIIKNAKK
jgi:glycosyltransferase involved in cell wall biosynthesis